MQYDAVLRRLGHVQSKTMWKHEEKADVINQGERLQRKPCRHLNLGLASRIVGK